MIMTAIARQIAPILIIKKTCGEGAKGAESRSYHRALMQPEIFDKNIKNPRHCTRILQEETK